MAYSNGKKKTDPKKKRPSTSGKKSTVTGNKVLSPYQKKLAEHKKKQATKKSNSKAVDKELSKLGGSGSSKAKKNSAVAAKRKAQQGALKGAMNSYSRKIATRAKNRKKK